MQALRRLPHIGIGVWPRVIPLVMLARRLQAAQAVNHFGDFLVDGESIGAGRGSCKRRTHHHHRMKDIGAGQRTPRSHGRTKIMADHASHMAMPQGLHQSRRIRHQLQHVAGLPVAVEAVVAAGGAAIAALIGSHHVVASRS
jgi:hypothetical protein